MEIAGNIYGDWEVIDRDKDKNWNCKCATCGMTKSIHEYSLTNKPPKCNHISKSEDLIDKQFGEWKVIKKVSNTKVLCECSCGKQKEVNKYTLINGKSTNCGHLKNKDRIIDLTGKQFNDLKVIKYLGDQYWECECSCGNMCKKHRNHLIDGRAHDCGHSRETGFIDIKDKRFGLLTVEKYVGNKNWLCKCDCGNTKIIAGSNLRNNSTISCGCIQKHISEREIIYASLDFKLKNGRLPYLYELAEKFNVNDRQMSYFISTRDVRNYINNSYSSKAEREIASLFDNIENKILGDKKLISPYELDIYLPDKKLAIEYNGNYWHSEAQKDSNYHRTKTFACAQKNVQLIHIFEYEWSDLDKQKKIKNMLIDKVYGTNKIYAKDTKIIEIDSISCKEFLTKYHIQSFVYADINIGCFYNNELIGVATFGTPRFGDTAEYELIRLCFKNGITVVGGSSKLFSYFVNTYKPQSVITYVNIGKFTGNTYPKLGFKFQKFTKPGYVWFNCNTKDLKSRYSTQKSKLVKDGLGTNDETEDTIMKRLGYIKIFDSGNLVLLWEANRCSVEENSQ